MKNPMIENNINADLFEAINENEVNGGAINIFTVIRDTNNFICNMSVIGKNCRPMPIISTVIGKCREY